MTADIAFWSLFAALVFGFALAVQMRVITAHVLRKALQAHDASLTPAMAGKAVVLAARPGTMEDIPDGLRACVAHLLATYPRPLSHLRLARRASLALPVAIVILVAIRRTLNGGF
ncbi:MAG: hypothetical protein GVY06_05775 [Alphaproteobacteria bacterium]|jgi:hypothetical protein|nr:hypothetical protein [Alphaproteobacteria bacterium]